MGKNLDRLFEQAKSDDHTGWKAHNKLGWIWDRHGEALVKALELVPYEWGNRGETTSLHEWNTRVKSAMGAIDTLLAALERDAKEGL